MVRTKADNSARKAVAAKAPRKQVGNSSAGCSSSKGGSAKKPGSAYSNGGGGNPVRVCPTPSWQKGIGEFYPKINKQNGTGSSTASKSSNGDDCGTSDEEHTNGVINGSSSVTEKVVQKEQRDNVDVAMEVAEEDVACNTESSNGISENGRSKIVEDSEPAHGSEEMIDGSSVEQEIGAESSIEGAENGSVSDTLVTDIAEKDETKKVGTSTAVECVDDMEIGTSKVEEKETPCPAKVVDLKAGPTEMNAGSSKVMNLEAGPTKDEKMNAGSSKVVAMEAGSSKVEEVNADPDTSEDSEAGSSKVDDTSSSKNVQNEQSEESKDTDMSVADNSTTKTEESNKTSISEDHCSSSHDKDKTDDLAPENQEEPVNEASTSGTLESC